MQATVDRPLWSTGHGHALRAVPDDLAAAVPLALFSTAVAAGFARVFSGWQFFDNLLALVVLGHGASFALRRARIAGWIALPVVALMLAWSIGAMHYRFTYRYLLPTSDTWNLFSSELDLVRDQFSTAVAPVIYGGGWDVLASIGVATTVLLSDAFAFRAYARAEALVPGGVLFVFVAALGEDRDRVSTTVALVAAGVLSTAMLRAYHTGRRSSIGDRRSSSSLALPGALGAAAAIALAAGVIGPSLPGAGAEPIYDATGGGGGLSTVVNPLVDIRSRLTNRSNAEMFFVQTNEPSYWRSAALAEFDGRLWGIPERRLSSAEGRLAVSESAERQILQNMRIINLGGSFVPAAPDPVEVTAPPGIDMRWSAEDATLFARDHELVSGDTFVISSMAPVLDAAVLEGATSADPGDPIYLELPDGYPDAARAAAAEATAGARTPYEAALLLQQWFRTEFRYSLDVQSGHGSNAIESFLRSRAGYCEQFAGTYASMMRSLGIPARVAVGFTQGTEQLPDSYIVRGKNAHAWPEVWFDGIGWVLFEPTPGRGAPGIADYTGVAPEQDESAVPPPEPGAEPAESPSVVPTTVVDPGFLDPDLGENFLDPGTGGGFAEDPAAGSGGRDVPVLAILAVLVLAAIAPAVSRWFARRRRAGAPASQLTRYWRRAVRSLEDVGVTYDPSDTPLEAARHAAQQFPISGRPIRGLAEAVTAATYRADGTTGLEVVGSYGHSTMRDCASWCRQIERAVLDSISYPARVARHFTRWR
jgi:transglutaminase-like putative cysteine protease